ncbi:non-ribosomal peptide synthetase [Brevibacillus dissolubilis]|uniref:non-ribosomal peptide synthetase n=1 Tax=Brevibacillus dissolubilis TaxID=1844116 RepID=UPI001116F804|nr:non-ribosomal peptide synthetase [Brevibacillus dissolubilis]
MQIMKSSSTLVEVLQSYAKLQPDKRAFTFLENNFSKETSLTYHELDQYACAIATRLKEAGMMPGMRALLLFNPGLDFIKAFIGCLYAGVIAVPAYPIKANRHVSQLQSIMEDAQPQVILTTDKVYEKTVSRQNEFLNERLWITVDKIDPAGTEQDHPYTVDGEMIAFLQYTSGSTGTPKGVMVTHHNLMHNERTIQRAFKQDSNSVIFGWLPLYHDMGLIGNILQPLYSGATCVFMSPMDFIQNPFLWLKGISDYKATTSGGPNFAYELCVDKITDEQLKQLDVSSWKIAFNGAEPIRANTLQAFAKKFSVCGFQESAFFPCYGLAESTLFVTGGPSDPLFGSNKGENNRVSCGRTMGQDLIKIVNPDTLVECRSGEVGEIWISGPSVTKGYWQKSKETHKTFHAYTADTNEGPFLRTGDVGFIEVGELYVTGRIKDLIIIRGRNYYPHDIEHTVEKSHNAFQPSACAAFSVGSESGEKVVIVQEIKREARKDVDVEELARITREAVGLAHELHVSDIVFVYPGGIPKTTSGKVQRFLCRDLYLANNLKVIDPEHRVTQMDQPADSENSSSHNPVEDEEKKKILDYLVHVTSTILKTPITPKEYGHTFVSLGVDSLAAIELKNRIDQETHYIVSEVDLLKENSIEQLAETILKSGGFKSDAHVQQGAADNGKEYGKDMLHPLSYGQKSMWVMQHLKEADTAYNVHYAMNIHSELNIEALGKSIALLFKRHPILTSTFEEVQSEPMQRFGGNERQALQFHIRDASQWSEQELQQELERFIHTPFDLLNDPLCYIHLFERTSSEYVLLFVFHHIITDLWSISVLMSELRDYYEEFSNGKIPAVTLPNMQYSDFCKWQAEMLQGEEGDRLWSYWSKQLEGPLPVLKLPQDHLTDDNLVAKTSVVSIELQPALAQKLKAFAASKDVTTYMFLLSLYKILLFRYTGTDDMIVGSPTASRSQREFQDTVGYFVNPIALRTRIAGNPTFFEFLDQVRAVTLAGTAHQNYPFSLLVDRLQVERSIHDHPIFQTMFVFLKSHLLHDLRFITKPSGEAEFTQFGGLMVTPRFIEQRSQQFNLMLEVVEGEDSIIASFKYNPELYQYETINRMAQQYLTLLECVLENPEERIELLTLLPSDEKQKVLVDWNQTQSEYPREKSIHQYIEEQVEAKPNAIALTDGTEMLTYAELNERANIVAQHIRQAGAGIGTKIGICMERTATLIVGMLGILKAGATYVPLDPAYPSDRLSYIMQDAQASLLITQKTMNNQFHVENSLYLDEMDWSQSSCVNGTNPCVDAEQPAYFIYTSGSTGKPKGVPIRHRSVGALMNWSKHIYSDSDMNGVLASTSICFDLSVFEIFVTLMRGGKIILVEHALQLVHLSQASEVTLINTVPSIMTELLRTEKLPDSVRIVNLAGEPVPPKLVQELSKIASVEKIWNLYGPSEDTTYSSFALIDQSGKEPITIGRPIHNTTFYVLDQHMQPVPIGIPGELYIGGDGLTAGYVNLDHLTKEKFVPNPFTSEQTTLYKTGDLVRYLADGNLEYLGRMDFQVKMNGQRIELQEIEVIVNSHESVEKALVTVHVDEKGYQHLVAYVTGKSEIDAAEITMFAREKLPPYMIPSIWIPLESFPLTPNGKIDRKALPAPTENSLRMVEEYCAPVNEVEESLVAIWREILGVEKIGTKNQFLHLGGNSLQAVRVLTRVRGKWGVDLRLIDFFSNPTIAFLAEKIINNADHAKPSSPLPAIARRNREKYRV